ncbi:hypothetical protein C8Q76DRAFT_439508 [Earliella scabrosa]|nr:hypothetical protein C8Q76DRAFT_439508 [Earliella scabrosa]
MWNVTKRGCDTLRRSTSRKRQNPKDKLVYSILADAVPSDRDLVVPALGRAAIRWKETVLWEMMVEDLNMERSVEAYGEDNMVRPIRRFGFDELKESIERTLNNEPSAVAALRFLRIVERWNVQRTRRPSHIATVRAWVDSWKSVRATIPPRTRRPPRTRT